MAMMPVGCTVVDPPGWPEERRPQPTRRIVATPGVMYGFAPLSWDLPDGRTVAVDVDELRLPPLARTADVEFAVAYVDGPGHALRCSTDFAPLEEGWFRCTGADGQGRPITFRLGPGERCELSIAGHMRTYATPACWRGSLTTVDGTFALERGYFENNGVIVGYVSWVDDEGPVFAANLVSEMQIALHDGGRPRHPADDSLVLTTVALHWFEQATDQD